MKPSDIVEHEKKYAKDKAVLKNKLDKANADRQKKIMAENESLENKIHDQLTSSVKKGKMLKTLTSTVTLDLDLGLDNEDVITKSKIRKQEAEAYL